MNKINKSYELINFNGKKLYELECLFLNKDPNNNKKLLWYNEKNQKHRDYGPACIEPNGICLWYKDGLIHRENNPAYINPNMKNIRFMKHNILHHIGGFAEINAKYDDYLLYIEGLLYDDPKKYLKNCTEWLYENSTAHDAIETLEPMEKAFHKGHLHAQNWKDGKFIKK